MDDALHTSESTVSIFDSIGGEPAVAVVVDLFYDRVLADPGLSVYFADVDLVRLKVHQRRFIGQALGATTAYTGRAMQSAHADLGLTAQDFDRVVGHLAASLAAAGVDAPTIETIAARLTPLKADIVTA